jgi:hypothetical protein
MIFQGMVASFKLRALVLPNPVNIALYTSLANLGYNTLVYTTLDEVVGTGYVAGGIPLIPTTPTTYEATAYISFANAIWPVADFICRGALIYDAVTLAAIAVLDFGSDKTAISPFTVTFPPNLPTTAILRFS